jgi:hypothetical protein
MHRVSGPDRPTEWGYGVWLYPRKEYTVGNVGPEYSLPPLVPSRHLAVDIERGPINSAGTHGGVYVTIQKNITLPVT